MSEKIIAIDLGGTSVKMAIISTTGEILEKWTVQTRIVNNGVNIVPDIIESIQQRLNLYQMNESDFIGIGMGTPGRVDISNKTVIGAYNLNWSELQEVGKAFSATFDIPFYIDNDANVAALGEQWQGAGNKEADVVMVTLGTGVGGGIIVGGQLVHGAGGAAGEIGHIAVDNSEDAITCTCGKKGCLEMVASATGILNLARRNSMRYEGDSKIKQGIDDGENISSEDIFNAAKEGDYFATSIVDEFAEYLGLAVSHLANTLNPSKIILGGGVSHAGEFLRKQVETYYHKNAFPQIKEVTEVVLATLANDAGILGAAHLVNLSLENKMV